MSDLDPEDYLRDTIAVIPKNARQEIRVRIGEYRGSRFADVRVFVDPPSDRAPLGRVPTKKGVAIPLGAIPDVVSALRKVQAIEAARQAPANQDTKPKTSTRRKAR